MGAHDSRVASRPRSARWLDVLGAFSLVGFTVGTLMSYGLVTGAPWSGPEPNEAEFFDRLGQSLAFLGEGVHAWVSGRTPLARPGPWLLAYAGPRLLSTGIFVLLIILLARRRSALEPGTPRRIFRWALAFGSVSVPAAPVYFQDFWVSIVWGRMVSRGLNPYYAEWGEALYADLPLDYLDWRMTYGPLWALISGAVARLGGWHWLAAAALFKLLLAAAWASSLWMIWRLLRRHTVWQQCVGLAIFGWLPLSALQTVADGHNDIVVVTLVLSWLTLLDIGRGKLASAALAASVVVKYVTAPLLILDVLHHKYLEGRRFRQYGLRAAGVVAVVGGALAIFFRSPAFFQPLSTLRSVSFFTPRNAATSLEGLLGLPPGLLAWPVAWFFPGLALLLVAGFVARPGIDSFRRAVLGVICAVLFSGMSYIWPWYLTWPLAVAALVPASALARWVLAAAIAFTFVIPVAPIFFSYREIALPLYGLTLLGIAPVWRRLLPDAADSRL